MMVQSAAESGTEHKETQFSSDENGEKTGECQSLNQIYSKEGSGKGDQRNTPRRTQNKVERTKI